MKQRKPHRNTWAHNDYTYSSDVDALVANREPPDVIRLHCRFHVAGLLGYSVCHYLQVLFNRTHVCLLSATDTSASERISPSASSVNVNVLLV